jgi:precorrin-2 dehydrogenase/sirohydrochlorin ferrochelatase
MKMTTTIARPVLFPLFLKLEGRTCLVVGGNHETEGKIGNLLASGAKVKLVSPTVTDGIRTFVAAGEIGWAQRRFVPSDLDGVTLVIALDDEDTVNAEVYREASARGVLCNVVDQPERCDFYYPAVVRRGRLQIAISTGGLSPALASQIRRDLDAQFEPAYGEWIEALGHARERVLRKFPRSTKRTRLLQQIASKRAFQKFSGRRSSLQQVQP